MPNPASRPLIMISHSGHDETYMRRIKSKLEKVGFNVWVYQDSRPGGQFVIKYQDAIQQADHVILLISQHSLASNYIKDELTAAYQQGVQKFGDFADFLFFIAIEQDKSLITELNRKMPGSNRAEVIHINDDNRVNELINYLANQHNLSVLQDWEDLACEAIAFMHERDGSLFCGSPTYNVYEALYLMNSVEIRHLPITADAQPNKKLLGIVSQRDIAKNFSANVHDGSILLEKIMTKFDDLGERFYFVYPNTSIVKAMQFFISPIHGRDSDHYVSALPILDSERHKRVIGILTYVDCVKAMDNGTIPIPNLRVRDCWKTYENKEDQTQLDVLYAGNTFAEAFTLVTESGRRTIPVVASPDDKTILGMVTDRKVLRNRKAVDANRSLLRMQVTDHRIMIPLRDLTLLTPSMKLEKVIGFYLGQEKPDALCVVNSQGSIQLAGILSYVDILKKLVAS